MISFWFIPYRITITIISLIELISLYLKNKARVIFERSLLILIPLALSRAMMIGEIEYNHPFEFYEDISPILGIILFYGSLIYSRYESAAVSVLWLFIFYLIGLLSSSILISFGAFCGCISYWFGFEKIQK